MNPRLHPVNATTGTPEQQQLLAQVAKAVGKVPNLVATLAQSPAAAKAYLAFDSALSRGSLPAALREQISLAVGEANSCQYCVSAHTLLGQKAGLSTEDVLHARRGTAVDAKTALALAFAQKVVRNRGVVTDEDVAQLSQDGYSEGEVVEIVANVALNIFTNYFNHIARTTVDFPIAPGL